MANIFPRWINLMPLKILACILVTAPILTAGVWYYFTPKYTRVGYMPTQPVPYSHELHVNQLGLDCRYCHSNVEVAGHSNVPTSQTCMTCHSQVQKENPVLQPVRDSYASGQPIAWTKVHKLPDYAYFNHAVHVNRGVSCASCHGQVNHMEVVWHAKSLSMGWCLECHRAPENHLREPENVFNLDWKPAEGETQKEIGLRLKEEWKVNPPTNCAGCHR